MATNNLDKQGLTLLWNKMKSYINGRLEGIATTFDYDVVADAEVPPIPEQIGVADYVVEQTVMTVDDITWDILKMASGLLFMKARDVVTKNLNYIASGNLAYASYTLTFPIASTENASVFVSTYENTGAWYQGTNTSELNKEKAGLAFVRNSVATNLRTMHTIVIIGKWK